jgi:hypothetical protein
MMEEPTQEVNKTKKINEERPQTEFDVNKFKELLKLLKTKQESNTSF